MASPVSPNIADLPPQVTTRRHRTAPASLPCFVRPLLQFVFYDLVLEDDVFADVVRKGGLATGFVVALLIPFSGFAHVQEVGVNPASIVFAVTVLATSIGWLVTYILARRGSYSTLTLITAGMAVDCIATAVSTVSSATQHTHVTLLVLLIVVGVFDLQRKWIWYLLFFLPYIVGAYNQTARPIVNYDSTPLFIDGATEYQTVDSRMIHHVTHFAVSVMIASCVTALHTEYRRQLSRVNASSVLAAFVAEDLAAYRTVRARQLLEAAMLDPDVSSAEAPTDDAEHHIPDPARHHLYRQDEEPGAGGRDVRSSTAATDVFEAEITPGAAASVRGADHALVDSLCTIVTNLEAYRPHLPNWLIDQAMVGPDPNGTEDTAAAGGGSTTTEGGVVNDASSVHARWGRRHQSITAVSDSASMRSEASSRAGPTGSRRALSHHAPMLTTRSLVVARARVYFAVCVVRESVRRTTEPLPPGEVAASRSDARHAAASAANKFVDAVHVIARATKAAVHSFVGDTVEVTWNAAAPVPVPAAKAARFLARLRTTVADECESDGLTVAVGGGAIVSKARVQLAGSGGSGAAQQSLMCSSSKRAHQWLTTLSSAGRKFGVMLADNAVAKDAVEMELRAVATLASSPRSSQMGVSATTTRDDGTAFAESIDAGGSSSTVPHASTTSVAPTFAIAYEIIAEGHVMSDDWLYVVRGDPAPTGPSTRSHAAHHAAVSTAFHKVFDDGDLAAAEELLTALPVEYIESNTMVRRLINSVARTKEAHEQAAPAATTAHESDEAAAASKAGAIASFNRAVLLE